MTAQTLRLLTALGTLGALAVSPASAVLLTYEGFDYTASANVTGQTGGSGWRNPASFSWTTVGTTGTVAASGLSYTGANAAYTAFASAGLAGNYGANVRNNRLLAIDTGGVYDTAGLRGAGNFIGGSTVTSTLWGSFLVGSTNFASTHMIFNLSGGTGSSASIRQGGAGGAIQITDGGSGTNFGTGSILTSALSTTNPNLIVFRMVFNGASDDTMSVWLNPTAATDTASILATIANLALNTVELRNVQAANLVFDEIRFGTTFADVVPIPEPSAFAALAGLGVLGLAAVRRRRRS